jgi:hypothetical protein
MASSIQGFTSLSINLDKSKTDLETEKGTNKFCAVKTRQQVSDENIWTPWNGGYSTPELQKLQRDDTDIGPILLWKENGSRPTIKELENKSPATRHYWHLWDAIEIREGLFFKKCHRKDGIDVYTQLLVPFEIKNEVLKKMHNSVMSGHLGKKKTKGKLSQRYYWYEMREDLSIREQTTS